jgi:SPP1 gp7 family putative phage head morphogenesis protein
LASITKYRQKWMKYHNSYEKRAYKELRKVFKKWNNKVFGIELQENSINQQLMANINANDMYTTYYNIYFNIGVLHGTRVGRSINVELNKDFTIPKFMTEFEKNLPLFLNKYGITRIQQVHKTYLEDVSKLFSDRLKEGKTLKETTSEVFKVMKSPRFYKYQAERIARTETTAAANYAAVQSGSVSGFVMEKRWISALDKRTRDPHASTNGQRVGEKEMFIVGGENLLYPGDPNGSAGNVINCRCTIAVIPKKDKNGRLIRTN